MMVIKILGTGCPNCLRLGQGVAAALHDLGSDATVEKVTNIADIMSYDVLSLPAVVIDEKVVVAGRVPDKEELRSIIQSKLAE